MELHEIEDVLLVQAFLGRPPLRRVLPELGRRQTSQAEARERQALYRALSCTDHERIRRLLFSALTEPIYRERGSMAPVEPFAAAPEVSRTARWLAREGWPFEEIQARLAGLESLWAVLSHTLPDSWRAQDVARTLCDWHREGAALGQIHRGLEAARALWRSDPDLAGAERLHHFDSFLVALIDVF